MKTKLYFRHRDNGAAVFRIDDDPARARDGFTQIAVINLRAGTFKVTSGSPLSDAETAEITDWLADQKARAEEAPRQAARALVAEIGRTAQWVQSQADDADIRAQADDLLLAMQDLRRVLVRRMAALEER